MAGSKDKASTLLATGIPLEMFAYDVLTTALDADWVDPEYSFASTNENNEPIQRSIDFAASVPAEPGPFSKVQIFFAVECKYVAPDRSKWLFMEDKFPRQPRIWDLWRPALWQDSAPDEPSAHATKTFPFAARGTFLQLAPPNGNKKDDDEKWEKKPSLDTALHQLRDAVHDLAIERFRLFTKAWSQPACLVFVPIVVTNADLRFLKDGLLADLEVAPAKERDWNEVSRPVERLLVRAPSGLNFVDRKWKRFEELHGHYDLSRVTAGLPLYKRAEQRTLEFHLRSFFESAPAYITVVRKEHLADVVKEVVEWARGLTFESPAPAEGGAP